MRRVSHFGKVSIVAALVTLSLAFVKFHLSLEAEEEQALATLGNTAKTVANALRLQMESDLWVLDSVANLWHLDSQLSRHEFRQYVLSPYFMPKLTAMRTVILVHRVQAQHRDLYEMDPESVEVREDCCNGTAYDIPSEGLYCRDSAKNQCRITGEPRLHITAAFPQPEGGKPEVMPASVDDPEHLVVWYQEPLELNPGPTGFDLGSLASRRVGFEESTETGRKAFTKRLLRQFATVPEYGMLVWNNVVTDNAAFGNSSLLQGAPIFTKAEVEQQGKEPYAIGSVVAVYTLQHMLTGLIENVFGRELEDTRLYLFDERPTTGESERLLAIYDAQMTKAEVGNLVVEMGEMHRDEIIAQTEHTQLNRFLICDGYMSLSVAVAPKRNYFRHRVSNVPHFILAITLVMIMISQLERWCGHPFIVSQHGLVRELIEKRLMQHLNLRLPAGMKCEDYICDGQPDTDGDADGRDRGFDFVTP